VILDALAKSPDERPGSARILAASLRAAYEAAGLVTQRDGHAPSSVRLSDPARERGRGPSVAALAAILAGGLVIGVALVFAFAPDLPIDVFDTDAGVAARDGGATALATTGTGPRSTRRATATGAPQRDATTGVDADLTAPAADLDATAPTPEVGTRCGDDVHGGRREDIAKRNTDEAARQIAAGHLDIARRLLDLAAECDPNLPDIAALRARLR
jgi:hypothetical protein